ncbi:MAG TPA: hypothetical protein VNP71_03265 [Thermoplasmata archaeon]|nr:hypothetical protein [Thermoplasmata archaeon]
MAEGLVRPKRKRSGHRGRMVVLGLILIGAGLVVFRYSADIAGQLDSYISPPPVTGNVTGLVSPGGWYLPYAVWGFGFTLIGLGGTMLRSAFMSGMMGGMAGGSGMSPDMLETYMQQAFSTTRGATNTPGAGPAPPTEVVKVKCRNCGNLEMEDAAFCRKCGEPL